MTPRPASGKACLKPKAFTLAEVMVVMGLLAILFIAGFGAITSMRLISHRQADYIAGMSLAEAKINDIRATAYPGTNGVFSSVATTTNINNVSVELNQAGTTFQVPGMVISTIQPIIWGHLVTVKAVIQDGSLFLTNTLQTVVNNYSGGRAN